MRLGLSLLLACLLQRQEQGRECDSGQMGCEDLSRKMGGMRSKQFPFSVLLFPMETHAAGAQSCSLAFSGS